MSLKNKKSRRACLSHCCYKEESFAPSPWLEGKPALHHHSWWLMSCVVRCLSLAPTYFNPCAIFFSLLFFFFPSNFYVFYRMVSLFSLQLLRVLVLESYFESGIKSELFCALCAYDCQRCFFMSCIHEKLAKNVMSSNGGKVK